MQQRHTPDTSEARGKEMNEESESRIATSSLLAGIPPDSPGDGGHYGNDEPAMYETSEHFPSTTDLDPHCGYVRHVGKIETGSNSCAVDQGGGKVLMVIMGVMLANKVLYMDSMEVIHMTLIGYPHHRHRYFLSNKY